MTRKVHLVLLKNGTYTFRIDGDQNFSHEDAVALINSSDILETPGNKEVLAGLLPAGEWLQEQRQRLSIRYPWLDILLEFGQDFVPVDHRIYTEERAGHCFLGSFLDATRMREKKLPIGYVEGLGILAYRVVHHAWTCYEDKAFDFSWPSPLLARYFGIPFDIEWMDEMFGILKGQGRVSVFHHWKTHQRQIETYLAERYGR